MEYRIPYAPERLIPRAPSDDRRARNDIERAERETRAQRHDRFAREYVIDLDATRAAMACGYHPDQAKHLGALLLARQEVKRLVRKYQAERASRLEVRADRVVEEIARVAFSNMLDYTKRNAAGELVFDLTDLQRWEASAIQELTTEEYADGSQRIKRIKVRLADKLKALELIGKYLALYPEHGQGQAANVSQQVQIITNVRLDEP